MSTRTAIPPTAFAQTARTRSSPETIAASLNEMEATSSRQRKNWHGNRTRAYPFWKVCQNCSTVYPCLTRAQAVRSKTCSRECAVESTRGPRAKKPMAERKMTLSPCLRCGKKTWRPDSWLNRNARAYCGHSCRAKHCSAPVLTAHKFDRTGMKFPGTGLKGDKNPAWKGGVTVFRTHGNYAGVRYVRCPEPFKAMARKDGYVMEHRLFVAQVLGRALLRSEAVHHLNHDPTDNRIENLALFASNRDHKLFEHHGTPAPIWSGSSPSTT